MKKLNAILLCCSLVSLTNLGFSQVPTTASETQTNQKLLENSKLAKENLEKQNANKVQNEIRTFGKAPVGANQMNLTDQDKQLSENYIHQGMANDIIKKNCTGEMQAVCNGEVGKHKFMGMDPLLVKSIAQMYTMFMSFAGDVGGLTKGEAALNKEKAEAGGNPDAPATEGADKVAGDSKSTAADKADKKANDYCKYIPTATEGIAMAVQMAKSKELEGEIGNGDTAQRDALLKAAKSHDSRAKMAQIQATGWWGGAACYAVNAATGQFAVDKNLAIKMGAATVLGAFYQNEVSANKDYAEKTRKIANLLPGKGDCNPVTDTLCYCSQPSTENDPTYCAKGLHTKKIATTSYRVACTDDKLKIDPTCKCEQSNSCFDNLIDLESGGAFGIGGIASANSPFSGVRSLARGELVGGTLNSQAYDRTSAIAKKGLREIASKVPLENSNLNRDQKSLADSIMSQGVPANVAAMMAQNAPSAAASSGAMARLSGSSGLKYAALDPTKKSNVVEFSGGHGLGVSGKSKNKNDGASDLLAKLKPGSKGAQNSKILEFAQKAEQRARETGQIRQGDDTPLFEIISLRYQTSGRRLLEVDSEENN